MNAPNPKIWQIVFALLGGALATASVIPLLFLLLALVMPGGLGVLLAFIAFIIAAPIACAHALALGLPLYLLLPRHWSLNKAGVAIAGFVIGAAPIGLGIYSIPIAADLSDTLARMEAGFAFGLLGAVGGLAFRNILQRLTDDWSREVS